MNPDTYIREGFLDLLGSSWTDKYPDEQGAEVTKVRKILLCNEVIRAEDVKDREDLVIVYGRNGEGELQQDLTSIREMEVGYDIIAFLRRHDSVLAFLQRFIDLLGEQTDTGRVKLATLPSTAYNEDLRAYSAQWRVLVRA